eukprot:gnl/Chilomastix_cuspidata/367.p1 GENE.gnl/Chilomastix_cuspidata/367~~gnl/Chilomastix_cuspidata/367.p1  ORF type:complete len:359 (+),score=174.54 gnl/Chilomastix_cuspidata/367:59-1135(+)
MDRKQTQAKRQIEFYFGDVNFPKDKHLTAKALENPNGFIAIEHINSFPRMKRLGLTVEQIAAALDGSDVVELNEDKTMIRRSKALPEIDTSDLRTLYVRGFPLDSTLDSIIEFVEDAEMHAHKYHVDLVRMRFVMGRNPRAGQFKGSVFLTLRTEAEAEEFWKEYGSRGAEAVTEPRGPIAERWEKDDIRSNLVVVKKATYQRAKRDARGGKGAKGAKAPAAKKAPFSFVQGLIVKVEGIGRAHLTEENTPDTDRPLATIKDIKKLSDEDIAAYPCCRELLYAIFNPFGKVLNVDFRMGAPVAHLRFSEEFADAPKKAVEELSGKLALGGSPVTLAVLVGPEEEAYMRAVARARRQKR